MVLQERIELSTSPLPRECSTTELLQQRRPTLGRVPETLRLALLPQRVARRKPAAAALHACGTAKCGWGEFRDEYGAKAGILSRKHDQCQLHRHATLGRVHTVLDINASSVS